MHRKSSISTFVMNAHNYVHVKYEVTLQQWDMFSERKDIYLT